MADLKRLKPDKSRQVFFFLLAILGCSILYFVVCFALRGQGIMAIFVNDPGDTFMDYFNSISNAMVDPYKDGHSNYPALSCLIYKLLYQVIPSDMHDIAGRDLRGNMYAYMGLFIFFITSFWIFLSAMFKRGEILGDKRFLASLAIVMSAPVLHAVERGNLILLAFALTLFFACFYDSDNKLLKELSFISLAIAAAIKIYPAVMGLLPLKQRKFKDSFRLVIYGLIAFFVPFFFYDGVESMVIMEGALKVTSNMAGGMGYNVSLYNICYTIAYIFNAELNQHAFTCIYVAAIAIIVAAFVLTRKRWKEQLCLVMLMILIPKTNYYYIMLFLIIPFSEALNNYLEDEKSTLDWRYAVWFFLLLTPWATPDVEKMSIYRLTLSYTMLMYYLLLLAGIAFLLTDVVGSFCRNEAAMKRIRGGVFVLTIGLSAVVLAATVL